MNSKNDFNAYLNFTTFVWFKTILLMILPVAYVFYSGSNSNSILEQIFMFSISCIIATTPLLAIMMVIVLIVSRTKLTTKQQQLSIYAGYVFLFLFLWLLFYYKVGFYGVLNPKFNPKIISVFLMAFITPAIFIYFTPYPEASINQDIAKPLIEDVLDDLPFEE